MNIDKAKLVIDTLEENTNQDTDNITDITTKERYGNNNNLSVPSTEQARERGRKGGVKSGENRAKRKTAQELLAKILATNMSEEQIAEVLGGSDSLLNGDRSAYNVMLVKMTQQAMGGDTKAFIALRDSVGDKPIDKQEISTEVITDKDREQIDKMRKQLADISKIG